MPIFLLKNTSFTWHLVNIQAQHAPDSTGKEPAATPSGANFLNPTDSKQPPGHLYFKISLLIEVAKQKEYFPNKA